jgi:hypothetical protein
VNAARASCVFACLALALTSLACDHSFTQGVRDDAVLRDRVVLAVPVGTDSAVARATMHENGFACVFRTGLQVDTLEIDDLEPPPARLTCVKDQSAHPETSDGFRRHFVDLLLDGARVAKVQARSRIERLP